MLRIIAGRWRGRRLEAPAGDLVRPTGDRIRESWMSIIHHDLPEARVLDLCAGSGALGLEAMSRGAATCDFVENAPRAVRAIEANLARLDKPAGATIHREDALRFASGLETGAYDIAFADPPYASGLAVALAECWLSSRFAHIFAVEHASDLELPSGGERRRYGSTALTFYR